MSSDVPTPESHPITVFGVNESAHKTPGMLGLTFPPGMREIGLEAGARWGRRLDADLDRLRKHHGTNRLASLMEVSDPHPGAPVC